MSSSAPVPPPKRWPRRLLLILLPLILIWSYWGVRRYLGYRELQAAIAETDAIDPGWRLEEMLAARKPIPDEQNAALVVMKAGKMLDLSMVDEEFRRCFPNEWIQQRLNVKQEELLQKVIEKNVRGLELARSIQDMKEGRFPFDYENQRPGYGASLTGSNELRHVVAALTYDAWLHAHRGKMEQACHSCLAALHAIRFMTDEPDAIAQVINAAMHRDVVLSVERILAQGAVAEPELRALDAALAQQEESNGQLLVLRGNRVWGLSLLADIDRNGNERDESTGIKSWREWAIFLLEPDYYLREQAYFLRLLARIKDAAELPMEQVRDAYAKIIADADRELHMATILVHARPDPFLSSLAHLRACRAALAAERYRLRHNAWPRNADDLVREGLLPEVLLDPYDGQPLRFKHFEGGLIVYSVHENGIDDDAASFRLRIGETPLDLGFQLWPGEQRGGEPLPEPREAVIDNE